MLYSTTRAFETDYGIQHTLTIEVNSAPELSQELVELVEDAFFYGKMVLGNNILENFKEFKSTIFPDKTLLNMAIFYLSNGKYKDVVKGYAVTKSMLGTFTIVISLENQVFHNMTPREIAAATDDVLRKPLWWENFEKKFYQIENCGKKAELVRNYLERGEVLKCYYDYDVYYFNIGIKEPEVTEYMLEEADWFLYNWI